MGRFDLANDGRGDLLLHEGNQAGVFEQLGLMTGGVEAPGPGRDEATPARAVPEAQTRTGDRRGKSLPPVGQSCFVEPVEIDA
jgi:hypothetical protein